MQDNAAPDTSNFLDWVKIKNFKSIKDLRLDCKRVNIFIGKPNVGKSNILEALGMLGVRRPQSQKYMDGSVRYSTLDQLFYDGIIGTDVTILSSLIDLDLRFDFENIGLNKIQYIIKWTIKRSLLNSDGHLNRTICLDKNGKIISTSVGTFTRREERETFDSMIDGPLKKYDFNNLSEFDNYFSNYLMPPNGDNLYEIFNKNNSLLYEITKIFSDQELDFILLDTEKSFALQKREAHRAKQYPYFTIADTFRRFMFYIAAIESNKNSVLVLEEPEVHSFPPYTKALAHRIASHDENQYFISTHSPYLLQTLISEVNEVDLAVYITYYKDYQTHVRLLTLDELQEAQDLSIDLFYNLSRYEPNA